MSEALQHAVRAALTGAVLVPVFAIWASVLWSKAKRRRCCGRGRCRCR